MAGIFGSGEWFWGSDQVDNLRRMSGLGFSAGAMAKEIGKTRNAVISKLYRLKIWRPGDRSAATDRARLARKALRAREHHDKAKAARERKYAAKIPENVRGILVARAKAMGDLPASESRRLPVESPAREPVTLLDLTPNHCRWPICDTADKLLGFCGADRRDDTVPYCAHHCRIAYRPRPALRKNQEESRNGKAERKQKQAQGQRFG